MKIKERRRERGGGLREGVRMMEREGGIWQN